MRTSPKDTLKIILLPVIIASLCCLSPVIFVLFGLSTVAFAGSLANTLYGGYKWLFRFVGLMLRKIITYLEIKIDLRPAPPLGTHRLGSVKLR